jgi:hypothetical protein
VAQRGPAILVDLVELDRFTSLVSGSRLRTNNSIGWLINCNLDRRDDLTVEVLEPPR